MKVLERAKVLAAEGLRARVEISAPAGETACGRCPRALSCSPAGAGLAARVLEVELPREAKAGEELLLEIELPSSVLAALLLFIVPLACAFGAGLATLALTASGPAALGAGAAGAGAVYALTYLAGGGSVPRVRIVENGAGPPERP